MSLFNRIIGSGETESKIPIHGIRALVGEIVRGARVPADVVTAFSLNAEEQSDLSLLLTKLGQHSDPVYMSRLLFDWLALAESNIMPEVYQDETAFWARLDAELV